MASLQALVRELAFIPLPQLAEKLEPLLSDNLDEQDRLLVMRLLLVCNRAHVVQRELEHEPEQSACLTDAPQYLPIRLRMALALGGGESPSLEKLPASFPRWIRAYASLGSEMSYPAELVSVKVAARENMVAVLNFTCPACGGTIATTASSQWLPLDAEKGEMLCIHCLAKLQWNKNAVRTRVFEYYDAFIASLPRTDKGLLSPDDVQNVAVLAVALRPFALIRFVKAFSERVGHFIADVFVYLRRRLAGLDEPSLDYVSLGSGTVCNAYLAELWDRVLQFQPFAEQVYALLRGTEHAYWMFRAAMDGDDGVHRFQISLPFTAKEHEKGLQCLDDMGIPRGSRIACLLVRDPAYMELAFNENDTNNIRNISVNTFFKSAKYLVDNGYYVLRMGACVSHPLSWANDRIIDYANRHRSEFMDLWLFSYCDLVLTTSTGIDSMRIMQGTNCLVVNFFPLPQMPQQDANHSVLFPHYVWKETGKRLGLQEVIELDNDEYVRGCSYESQGVLIQSCSDDEILDAVQEKLFLMRGGRIGERDAALQYGFKNFFKINKKLFAMPSSMPSVANMSTYRDPLRGYICSVWARQYADELLNYI